MSAIEPRRVLAGAALAGAALLSVAAIAHDAVRRVPLAAAAPQSERSAAIDAKTVEVAPSDTRSSGFEARALPTTAVQSEMTVLVDRAKIIRLPERAQTIVIGNPAVADIAVQKNGVVVLTGKSFGVTNFIAMDSNGNQIAESKVAVTAPSDGTLLVQRGLERQTYSCAPKCLPTVQLGDSSSYFGEVKGQADAHGSFAAPR